MTLKAIIRELKKLSGFLESFVPELKKNLSNAPEGTLQTQRSKGKVRFLKNEVSKVVYLGSSVTDHIRELAQKRYDSIVLKRLELELIAIRKAIRKLESIKAPEDVLNELGPVYRDIVQQHTQIRKKQLQDWQNQPYRKKPIPEKTAYMSLRNEPMRSKSEVLVADRLFFHLVPYRYEQEMDVTEFDVIHPDFTIRHPVTGEIFIWEHFGMMDDQSYVRRSVKRVNELRSKGFILGKNLIITMESKDYPLDINLVEELIAHYFL